MLKPLTFTYFRLHDATERNLISSQKAKDSKGKKLRMRRHQMRKILLALDYLIETIGGLFIFLVFFIGENKVSYSLLYQQILFCVGTFIYGILIPIAYLLNESRVRNIIVNHGWVEGFKSIFYSNGKIRELDRQEIRKRSVSKTDKPNGMRRKFQLSTLLREQGDTLIGIVINPREVESFNMEQRRRCS